MLTTAAQTRAPHRSVGRLAACALFVALAFAARTSAADPPSPADEAAAQALYTQATSEMDKKSFATACPKLEEVTRLVPAGIGAKITLAECYEGLGRIASAWSTLELARSMAERTGQNDRAALAAEKAAKLHPKLAYLTVRASAAVRGLPGLTLSRDGTMLGAVLDTPLPVDIGVHRIEVSAKGYKPFKAEVDITADGVKQELTIPALTPDSKGDQGSTPAASGWPWQRSAGLSGMGIGAAGLVVAGVLAGLAVGKKDESNGGACNDQNICDNRGLELRAQAVSLANGATGALIASGALAAGGLTLFLLAPSGAPATRGEKVSVRLELLPGSAQLRGSF